MLEPPPATGANRFLTGWRAHRRQDEVWLTPSESGARLEIATLAGRPRQLVLEGVAEGEESPWAATVGDRPPRTVEVSARTEIDLPEHLPTGRLTIELHPPAGSTYAVRRAGLSVSAPGEAEIVDGEIVQSGWSAVDLVKWIPSGSELRGTLAPPAGAAHGQVFSIRIQQGEAALEEAFRWRPGLLAAVRGDATFAVELGSADGPVRIRMSSEGDGPAARWKGLRILSPPVSPTRIAPPPQPRLVVVYVMDALRSYALAGRRELAAAPVWSRLAAEGATFDAHMSQAPNTLPSTKTLFVGQPFLARGGWKLAADGPPTLAELYAAAGFRTALFSANPNVSDAYGTTRGFSHVAEEVLYPATRRGGPDFNDSAATVQGAALSWLESLQPEESAFVYLHTMHPHNPYDPPPELAAEFTAGIQSTIRGDTRTLLALRQRRLAAGDEDRRRLAALYAASLAYNDALLGPFVAELEDRFGPEQILLVLTSDHGEELFEHGGVLHGYTLYDEMLQIPLAVRWPGHVVPGRHPSGTDTLDLHATLRELVATGPAPRGRSLWPALLGQRHEAAGRVQFAAASSLKGGLFMARSRHRKLVLAPRTGLGWGMGEGLGRSREPEYQFDLEADPGETVNLAGERSLEGDWLRARLLAWIERERALEAGAEAVEIDDDIRERLEALGYLN